MSKYKYTREHTEKNPYGVLTDGNRKIKVSKELSDYYKNDFQDLEFVENQNFIVKQVYAEPEDSIHCNRGTDVDVAYPLPKEQGYKYTLEDAVGFGEYLLEYKLQPNYTNDGWVHESGVVWKTSELFKLYLQHKNITPHDQEEYKKITGFNTPQELDAYEKGREHEGITLGRFIENWDGSTNSVMGQRLHDKFESMQHLIKEILVELIDKSKDICLKRKSDECFNIGCNNMCTETMMLAESILSEIYKHKKLKPISEITDEDLNEVVFSFKNKERERERAIKDLILRIEQGVIPYMHIRYLQSRGYNINIKKNKL